MKLYLKAASVLALSLPMMAFAEDCVPELDDHCPAGVDVDRYCVVSIDAVSCPASGLKRSNPILLTSPPAQSITSATCNYTGGGYTCTAWPACSPRAGCTPGPPPSACPSRTPPRRSRKARGPTTTPTAA